MNQPPDVFDVVVVDDWELVDTETTGSEEKYWLRSGDGDRWLFKPRTEHDAWSQGEDWAEKIATEVAGLVGVPAARVELASRSGRAGSISLDLRPHTWELQSGGLLLSRIVPLFVIRSRDRAGYTLANVQGVLADLAAPPGVRDLTAFETFAGYLVLDALVANQDRHEENWAVLRPLPGGGVTTLAPSYDHGSALGFNLTDDRRRLLLGRDGVEDYCLRARAQRFDHAGEGQLSLVELACRALHLCSPAARRHWLDAIEGVDEAVLANIVARIPEMSDSARTVAGQMLAINRRRLLDECTRAAR